MTVVLISTSVVLGSCGGADDAVGSATPPPTAPSAESTGTPSATSDPTSDPTTTTMGTAKPTVAPDPAALAQVPKAARAHTYAGAQAFAEFYLRQLNEAWSKPDPEAIRPYATSACKTCAAFVSTATSLKDKGHRYDGSATTVEASAWLPESTRNAAIVDVITVQQRRKILDQGGEVVRTTQRQRGVARMKIVWGHVGWQVARSQLVRATSR